MLPFDELALFAKVAETKNFSAAARQLGISSSTASDYVNRLEDRLGLKLFNRSTRRVELTEAGTACYEHATGMVASAEKAMLAASEFHSSPQGVLRISCPETFTEMHIAPLLGKYLQSYPKVSIETSEGAHQANLIGEQFDLAIRIGRLTDSTLTV
ncbi:MAG: LysR family transcriptional regulator, partial [Halioglobus sp.]